MSKDKWNQFITQPLAEGEPSIIRNIHSIINGSSANKVNELKGLISQIGSLKIDTVENIMSTCKILSIYNYALTDEAKKKNSMGWYDLIDTELDSISEIVENITDYQIPKFNQKYLIKY